MKKLAMPNSTKVSIAFALVGLLTFGIPNAAAYHGVPDSCFVPIDGSSSVTTSCEMEISCPGPAPCAFRFTSHFTGTGYGSWGSDHDGGFCATVLSLWISIYCYSTTEIVLGPGETQIHHCRIFSGAHGLPSIRLTCTYVW